jgi:hypothetical protein
MLLIWMAEGTQRGKKTLRCFIYVLTSVGQLLEQGQVPIGEKEKKSMKITIYIHVELRSQKYRRMNEDV